MSSRRVHPANPWISNPLAARCLIFCTRHPVPVLGRLLEIVLNCDFRPRLLGDVFLPHPYGIIVTTGTEIGHDVVIMQQVTLGGKDLNPPSIVVEDDVYIGAGAKVLGTVRLGRGCKVGANAVVTEDVPPGATVVGYNRIIPAEAAEPPPSTSR